MQSVGAVISLIVKDDGSEVSFHNGTFSYSLQNIEQHKCFNKLKQSDLKIYRT